MRRRSRERLTSCVGRSGIEGKKISDNNGGLPVIFIYLVTCVGDLKSEHLFTPVLYRVIECIENI
eukprot:COSAG01_NODE_67134_length_268_cov_0.591716_1_plen_64_part_10